MGMMSVIIDPLYDIGGQQRQTLAMYEEQQRKYMQGAIGYQQSSQLQQNLKTKEGYYGELVGAQIQSGNLVYNTREGKFETANNKGVKVMNSFKIYLNEHKDFIFTLMLIFIADHFLLGGALKEKLKATTEKFLDRAHNKLDSPTSKS